MKGAAAMRIKPAALICMFVLIVLFGGLTGYADDTPRLDRGTEERLRDAYGLEAPPETGIVRMSDIGFSREALDLARLLGMSIHPLAFIIRGLLMTMAQ